MTCLPSHSTSIREFEIRELVIGRTAAIVKEPIPESSKIERCSNGRTFGVNVLFEEASEQTFVVQFLPTTMIILTTVLCSHHK